MGKIAVPDAILNKPGKLTAEEFEQMKRHTEVGYAILRHSTRELLRAAAVVAHEHHERWDGTGYPRGLRGEEIHIYGRITALADVFDALVSPRTYKPAFAPDRVARILAEARGAQFDPRLVDLFLRHADEFLALAELPARGPEAAPGRAAPSSPAPASSFGP
ncbi:MAG: hypothetical protein Kow0092_08470 [Deferrisomatales bacterium]